MSEMSPLDCQHVVSTNGSGEERCVLCAHVFKQGVEDRVAQIEGHVAELLIRTQTTDIGRIVFRDSYSASKFLVGDDTLARALAAFTEHERTLGRAEAMRKALEAALGDGGSQI